MARSRKRQVRTDRGGDSAAIARRREEVLRPCPTLGYDWDALAMHLIAREAFGVAEAQLRRAVWLNPYEPRFKVHLALCLCRGKRYADARAWIEQVPPGCMAQTVASIKRLMAEGEQERTPASGKPGLVPISGPVGPCGDGAGQSSQRHA